MGFGTDRWVLPASAKNETVAMLYTYCFYWSTLLLSTIGDVPLPIQRIEYLFVLFDFMIGMLTHGRTYFECIDIYRGYQLSLRNIDFRFVNLFEIEPSFPYKIILTVQCYKSFVRLR